MNQEKKLIKGIVINRFRGDLSLFNEGKKWIEIKLKFLYWELFLG